MNKRPKRILRRLVAVAAAASVIVTAGCATTDSGSDASAADYPTPGATITMLLSFSAGGGTDIAARTLAEALEEKLGVNVVVENLSGGGGMEAVNRLLNAKPDGYTLALMPMPSTNIYYLDETRNADFSAEDLTFIATHDSSPGGMSVAADSPFTSLAQVMETIAAEPRTVSAGSSGVLALGHLTVLQMQDIAGGEFAWTSFDDSGTLLASVLGGNVDVYMGGFGEISGAEENGQIRYLSSFGSERSELFPDVPTAVEQGYDIEITATRVLTGPAGMPQEVVEKLETAVEEITSDPAYQATAAERDVTLSFAGAAEAQQQWEEMDATYAPLVEQFRQAGQ